MFEGESTAATAAVPASDLLTKHEAAAYLGIKVTTFSNYRQQGRIAPIPETAGRGKRSLYRREDLTPLLGGWERYQARRRERREAILAAGVRLCSGTCGRTLPLDQYEAHPAGIGGRHSRCPDCRRADGRAHAQKHRDRRIAYKREYRKTHREAVQAYKREYQRRITREKTEAWENLRAYFRVRHHLLRAVEDGKTSPICRKAGFALVRLPEAEERFRAARLDHPLRPGERAIAHYQYIPSANRWVCLGPSLPLRGEADRDLLARLIAREKKLKGKAG